MEVTTKCAGCEEEFLESDLKDKLCASCQYLNEKAKELGESKRLTPELARALLEAERQARIERCRRKIEQALTEERCFLDSSIIITAQGNIPQINIRARPETEQIA